eukprot:g23147.t1
MDAAGWPTALLEQVNSPWRHGLRMAPILNSRFKQKKREIQAEFDTNQTKPTAIEHKERRDLLKHGASGPVLSDDIIISLCNKIKHCQ